MKYIRIENDKEIEIPKYLVELALAQHQPHLRPNLRKALRAGVPVSDGYGALVRRKYLPRK